MAKRFTKSTIKWENIAKLVPPEEKGKFLAFKGKADVYLRRVIVNPEIAPKIDWESYEKKLPDSMKEFVGKLKSSYESFKVPFPDDKMTVKVDEQWKDLEPKIKTYCEEQQKVADAAKIELDKLNALPSFDDITMEMVYDMYPEMALAPVKKPTFWPHTEDEQLGYVPPELKAQKGKGH